MSSGSNKTSKMSSGSNKTSKMSSGSIKTSKISSGSDKRLVKCPADRTRIVRCRADQKNKTTSKMSSGSNKNSKMSSGSDKTTSKMLSGSNKRHDHCWLYPPLFAGKLVRTLPALCSCFRSQATKGAESRWDVPSWSGQRPAPGTGTCRCRAPVVDEGEDPQPVLVLSPLADPYHFDVLLCTIGCDPAN